MQLSLQFDTRQINLLKLYLSPHKQLYPSWTVHDAYSKTCQEQLHTHCGSGVLFALGKHIHVKLALANLRSVVIDALQQYEVKNINTSKKLF